MRNRTKKIELTKYMLIIFLVAFIFYKYVYTGNKTYLLIVFSYIIIIGAYELFNYADRLFWHKVLKTSDGRVKEQKNEIDLLLNQSFLVNSELRNSVERYNNIKQQLNQKSSEFQALRDASKIVTATTELEKVIEHIYKIFNKFTGCDRCLVSFIDKENNELVCKYEYGNTILNEVGAKYGNDSTSRTCFDSNRSVLRLNVLLEELGKYGDRAAFPLNISEELIGVVYIESSEPGKFLNINLNFFESLANYAAIAINNAELFQNIYVHKQEIEALYEETAAVNDELTGYIEDLSRTKEELKQKNVELVSFYDEIHTGYLQTVMALANSIEAKDPYTRGHCQRVMEISIEIAARMGLTEEEIRDLKYSAILHDIGKIGTPANILNKAGKLSDEEFSEIKKHPLIAYNILKDVEFLKYGLDAILQHHERHDGKGYPYGISGEEIGVFGKILCVADAFDAMTSDRPYRKGMPMEDAMKEIERCSGTQFDPEIVRIFVEMSKGLISTYSNV